MEIIITMSIICIAILLLMQYMRMPRRNLGGISGDTWYYPSFLIVLFACALIFVAAFREGFQDTGVYKNLYKSIGTDYANAFDKEFAIQDQGFNLLMVLLNRVNSDPQTLIIVSAVVITASYIKIITKHSCDLPFSLFLMLCVVFISTMNGLRQVLAGVILVMGWPLIRERKPLLFALVALLASTFHASAIIVIPLYFIISGRRYNPGIWLFLLFVVLCFASPSAAYRIMGDVLEDSLYKDYLENESKMGVMRLIVESVPVVISLLYHKINPPAHTESRGNSARQRMIDVLINMQIVSLGFTALGLQMVYFARISMYFSLVLPLLLPETIKGVFNKESAGTVKRIAIMMYLFYYAYQIYTYEMIDGWGGMELIF